MDQTMAPFSSEWVFNIIRKRKKVEAKKKFALDETNPKEWRISCYVHFPLMLVKKCVVSFSFDNFFFFCYSIELLCERMKCHKVSPCFAVYDCYCDPSNFQANRWIVVLHKRTLFCFQSYVTSTNSRSTSIKIDTMKKKATEMFIRFVQCFIKNVKVQQVFAHAIHQKGSHCWICISPSAPSVITSNSPSNRETRRWAQIYLHWEHLLRVRRVSLTMIKSMVEILLCSR